MEKPYLVRDDWVIYMHPIFGTVVGATCNGEVVSGVTSAQAEINGSEPRLKLNIEMPRVRIVEAKEL